MSQRLLLFFIAFLQPVAGRTAATIQTAQETQQTVRLALEKLGLSGDLELLPQANGLLFAKPKPGQEFVFTTLLADESNWRPDSQKRSHKKGANDCYRHRQAEVGSLHFCLYTGFDARQHYTAHVDWHYAGWDHPVSAAKHVIGECWPHRIFRTRTNQRRLAADILKNAKKTGKAFSYPEGP